MNTQDQISNDQAPAQDQPSNTQALVEFAPFPGLYPDLRVVIWKATLIPRVFSRRCLSVNSNQPLRSVDIPSLLSVNAETRYEALKWYKNIAISTEYLRCLRRSGGHFWISRGESLRILFNPEIDVIVDENLRCDFYPLSNSNDFNANSFYRSPLLIDPDFVKKVQVSPDVFMSSSWTWDQMLWNWQDNYYGFEDFKVENYPVHRAMFTDLRFNNLSEFVVQDVDCALPHQLDSPETRATWKRILEILFKAETTRERKAHTQVSIPKIVIRSGAKVSLCDHCIVRFTPWTKWPLEPPFPPY
ncbi:hypothetical protein EAE96_009066 [Botrytis aclada]|nr:hypothetical protein EAE96_009066 [Botrytis aclada]